MHAPAQFDILQPVQDEQRAFDAGVGEMTKSAQQSAYFAALQGAAGRPV